MKFKQTKLSIAIRALGFFAIVIAINSLIIDDATAQRGRGGGGRGGGGMRGGGGGRSSQSYNRSPSMSRPS